MERQKKWDERRQVYLDWEESGWSQSNTCHVTKADGQSRIIHKHGTQSGPFPGTHGGYVVGREWYTVDGNDVEHDTFDAAIAAAFA